MDEATVTPMTRSVTTALLATWLLLEGASGAVTCRDARRVTIVCNTSCCGSYDTTFYCCRISTPAPATVRWQYSVGAALGGVLLVIVVSTGIFLYVRSKRPCRTIRPGTHPPNQHLDRTQQPSIRYTVSNEQPLPAQYPVPTDQQTPVQCPVSTEQQLSATHHVSTDKQMSTEHNCSEQPMISQHTSSEEKMSTQHTGSEEKKTAWVHQEFSTQHRVTIEQHLPVQKTAELDQDPYDEQTVWNDKTVVLRHRDPSDKPVSARKTVHLDESGSNAWTANTDQGSSNIQPARPDKTLNTDSPA